MHLGEDLDRRDINLNSAKVSQVLPEYYADEYPNIVNFLEKYYNFLESDGTHSFNTTINNLISIRDIGQTDLKYLDLLVSEIGNGLQVASFFEQPRLMTRLLSEFYRSKGSLVSVEGFFRAFFNDEVSIEYTKNKVFNVGDSKIGYESQKFITNNELYQTFALLIKSGVSVPDYQNLYEKFVHPAGFYYQGQIQVESEFNLGLDSMRVIPFSTDSSGLLVAEASEKIVISSTSIAINPDDGFVQLTAFIDSEGDTIRIDPDVSVVEQIEDLTLLELGNTYPSFQTLLTPNSFKFDDSNEIGPDMTINLETMDNTMFNRYMSDSAI